MTMENMKALAKQHGAVSFAKVILSDTEKYAKSLSEEEFVDLIMHEARAYQKTGETNSQAFSRLFSSDSDEGLLLRQAHAAVNKANRPSMPTAATVSKSAGSAYDKLMERANQLRSLEPDLTLEQAFAKVYTNPVNADLSERERRENRPVPTEYPKGGERQ